jgi:predicted DNA binding protein
VHFLDTRVRIQHECPFCEFSARFPEVQMVLWYSRDSEILEVTAPDPVRLDEILEAARESLGACDMFQDGRSALLMTCECGYPKFRSIISIANDCGCMLVPPHTYEGGWETHRVLSTGTESLRRFVSEIERHGKVEIISHRGRDALDAVHDLNVVPVHFFEGLTDLQIRSVVAAYEAGLFEVPARTKMDDVARAMGLSRSTLGEHLRKAELQMLRNSYPFLKLRATHPREGHADKKGDAEHQGVEKGRGPGATD